jgi:hypothetical protein
MSEYAWAILVYLLMQAASLASRTAEVRVNEAGKIEFVFTDI